MEDKPIKFQRTTTQQLIHYLTFLKKYPELKAGKNSSPRAMELLWEQLTKELNGIRGPTRTPSQWKVALKNWKNTVRSRARRSNVKARRTEGIYLKRFEEEVLHEFGIKGVDGIKCGLSKLQTDSNDEQVPEDEVPPMSPSFLVASPLSSDSVLSPSPPSSSKKKEIGINQLFEIVVANMEAQARREERMLQTLGKIGNSFVEVMEKIATSTVNKATNSSSISAAKDEWDKTALSMAEHMRNAANEFPHLADKFRVQQLQMSLDVQKERITARSEEANEMGLNIDIKSELN